MKKIIIDLVLDHIKYNNLIELNNILNIKNYNEDDINILFTEAIKKDIPFEKIKFLLKKYKNSLYKFIRQTDDDKCPLFIAIQRNNYKVADLLIEIGANINAIPIMYLSKIFNSKNSKYILSKGLKVTSSLICYLIENKINHFLKYFFENYLFDNKFIINLLLLSKSRKNIPSREQFNQLIHTEISKIQLTDLMYDIAEEYDNEEALKIFEKYCENPLERIKKLIRNNNIKEFEYLIKNKSINLLYYCNKYDLNKDLLFYSIQQHASPKIMDLIIEECHYECLNYDVCINEQILPLLFALLYRYYFKAFDYLIKKGADINNPKKCDDRFIDYRRVISILYENEDYQNKTIKYIFNTQFNITSDMVNGWIMKNQRILLNKILKIYVYNNCFILNLLTAYKNKVPLSNHQLYDIINKEKNKVGINKSNYEEALNNSNYEFINILYEYDYRDKDIALSELFSLFHYEEKCNGNGKKLLFIRKLTQGQLKINVNGIFMDNIYYSEEKEEELLNYVNSNDVIQLKNFLKENELSIAYYNRKDFDLLIYAIENEVSFEMVKFIITQYTSLNYAIINHRRLKYKSPLISAIIKKKFRIFTLLIQSGADINYKIDGQNIITVLYNSNFNLSIFKFLFHNGLLIDEEVISFLRDKKNFHYLRSILECYIYENSYIINLLLLRKQCISLSDIELNQVLNKKGLKLDFPLNYDWFYSIFEHDFNYIKTFINFGQYHCSSCLSEEESCEVLEIAIEKNELVFIDKFLESPFFNFSIFHLEEFLSEKYFTYQKIENRTCILNFFINKLVNHPLFEFNVKSFENTLSNIYEIIPYDVKLNNSYHFIKNFIETFFDKRKHFDMAKYNFETAFGKLIKYSVDASYYNIIIKNLLDHEAFDFKQVKFEKVLESIISVQFSTIDEIIKFYKSAIKKLLHHKTLDYKNLNFEKSLSCLFTIKNNHELIDFFINEIFKLKNFDIKNISIEDLVSSTIKNLNSNRYSVVYKLINRILKHKTFNANNKKCIKEIISTAIKVNLITPIMIYNLNNLKVSEYIIESFVNHELFVFNSENVENIILSTLSLTTNANSNNNNLRLFDNIMNQIFNSKKFKTSYFNIYDIDFERMLLKAIQCNNIYIMKLIFKNVLKSFDLKLIYFEKVLLLASKIGNIKAMEFLIEKLLNITMFNKSIDPINMQLLLSKLREVDTPFLTLIINIFLKLNYFKLVKQLMEGTLFRSIIDINCKDKNGEYPLFIISYLVSNNNKLIDIFELFLKYGANMFIKDNSGYTLLMHAMKNSNYSIIIALFKHQICIKKEIEDIITYENDIELIKAIYHNQLDAIKSLSGNMNKFSNNCNNYFTPLILSYLLNCKEIYKYLIEKLSFDQILEYDGNGFNIFHYILFKNDIGAFYRLSEKIISFKKDNINIKNKYFDYSVLDVSIHIKNIELFSFILKHCEFAYTNSLNKNSNSPLLNIINLKSFSIKEKMEWISLLLKNDNNIIEYYGSKMALIDACKLNIKPIIKLLIKNGATLNATFNHSRKVKSVLSYIIDTCDTSIIKYLAKNYCECFTVDIIKEIIMKKDYNLIKTLIPDCFDINNYNSIIDEAFKTNDVTIINYISDCIIKFRLTDINIILKKIIYDNNLESLKLFIPKRIDVNMKDNYGMTPLYHALEIGRGNIVKYLIEKGAKIEKITLYKKILSEDDLYETEELNEDLNAVMDEMKKYFIKNNDFCLYPKYIKAEEFIKYAIEVENIHALQFIINQGIDINRTEEKKDSVLIQAIKKNNFDIVKLLIKSGTDINLKDGNNNIPIIYAIDNININNNNNNNNNIDNNNYNNNNSLGVIRYLINKGVKINFTFEKYCISYTPLSYLIITKYNSGDKYIKSIIKWLIYAGSDVTAVGSDNQSLFYYAVKNGDDNLFKLLIDRRASLNKPEEYVNQQKIQETEKEKNHIIKCIDFNVNEKDSNENTLLFFAIKNNNEALVKFLIERGANVNVENKWKDNPLIYAMKIGNLKIIEYLIQNGARIDKNQPNFIHSPFDMLQKYKNKDEELLRYLIDRFNANDPKGVCFSSNNRCKGWNNSFLIIAVKSGNEDIIKYALKRYNFGILNLYDENNKTSLDYVLKSKNKELLCFLLKEGACRYNSIIPFYKDENVNFIEKIIKKEMNSIYFSDRSCYKSGDRYAMNKNVMNLKFYFDSIYTIDPKYLSYTNNNLSLMKHILQNNKYIDGHYYLFKALVSRNISVIKFVIGKISPQSCDKDILKYDDVKNSYTNENLHIYYECKKLLKFFFRNN